MGSNWRLNFIYLAFICLAGLLIWRLFYWQVVKAASLSQQAENQHMISFEIGAERGQILASDGFPLVNNVQVYLLFASIPDIKEEVKTIAAKVAPLIFPTEIQLSAQNLIKERLNRSDLVWVPLKHKVNVLEKEKIEKLKIEGLGFEEESGRSYPEGSASAHIMGFVGSDINGGNKGYFGLEGYYDLELRGRAGTVKREKDATGQPILVGVSRQEEKRNGADLLTNIDRTVQFMVDEKLKSALKRYGAVSGTVTVMDSNSGAILAMSAYPNYDPVNFEKYDKNLYPNPLIASAYEPGSTFKVLVMSAALNEGVVGPETRCDQCDGPRTIYDQTISTWNSKYFPDSTMTEVIQHSDNVGMVFVGDRLGKDKMLAYFQKFGLGKLTGIDLQEESTPMLRAAKDWGPVDLATATFGQGIALTPIQMITAVNVIANRGIMVRPFIVKKISSSSKLSEIKPPPLDKVIEPTAAEIMTEMMVNAVDNGEAKWAKPVGYRIAGKTGTAQIAVAGHYDEDKTIASFVGFAPADKPKFTMLVTLREPSSSPWGSETAAPLWFDIAKDLFNYYGILPNR